ncbi:MAG: HAMP domain-containing protein, partial [Acidimicrobiales bacterium]|nr:HAMP domain-containing protein [Acidimicrobiales bacterium]
MHSLSKLSVSRRLSAGFGAVALLILVVAGIAIANVGSVAGSVDSVADDVDYTHDAMELRYDAADLKGWQTAYAYEGELGKPIGDGDGARAAFLAAEQKLREDIGTLRSEFTDNAVATAALDEAVAHLDEFMAVDAEIVANLRAGDPASRAAAEEAVLGTAIEQDAAITAAIDKAVEEVDRRSEANRASATSTASTSRTVMIIAGVFVLALSTGAGMVISRSIVRPLNTLGGAMNDIATGEGDLTRRLDDSGKDEIARVAHAFNLFAEKIRVSM